MLLSALQAGLIKWARNKLDVLFGLMSRCYHVAGCFLLFYGFFAGKTKTKPCAVRVLLAFVHSQALGHLGGSVLFEGTFGQARLTGYCMGLAEP